MMFRDAVASLCERSAHDRPSKEHSKPYVQQLTAQPWPRNRYIVSNWSGSIPDDNRLFIARPLKRSIDSGGVFAEAAVVEVKSASVLGNLALCVLTLQYSTV